MKPRTWLTAVGAVAVVGVSAALFVVFLQPPAQATVAEPTTPVTGNATYFDALGAPYGGCGMPQADLETQDFVALNVFNTPGDGTFYPRPLSSANADKMGIWNNGRNCGRWVQVKISDYCTGTNDGALGQAFCRNGAWSADAYNGGVLNMIVADSCGDSNAWCRDDPYHLDLSKPSLNRFVKNGAPLADLYPNHWNNRHVSWNFIPAPAYSGDIQVGFLSGAQRWWPAISVSHLANGIHGVEYFTNGAWQAAPMNGDMGQSYVIGGTTSGGTQFKIRVRDVSDALINNGRVYNFSLPDACSAQCGAAYTKVTYTTDGASPSPSSPASPSASASASRSPSTSPSPSGGGSSSCTASSSITSSWSGGYQAAITVRNNGTAPSTAWTVSFSFAGTQHVNNAWNAVVTQTGQQVTAVNQSYNGSIPASGTAGWGMVVDGTNQPLTGLTCTVR